MNRKILIPAVLVLCTGIGGYFLYRSSQPAGPVQLSPLERQMEIANRAKAIEPEKPRQPVKPPEPVRTILVPDNLSAGDPYLPELGNRGYDVQQYTLHMTLDPKEVKVNGRVQIDAICTAENLQQVSFDLNGYEIDELNVDKAKADYFRQSRKLIVNLPKPLTQGSSFVVDIAYQGDPVRRPSALVPFIEYLGMHFNEDSIFVVCEPDGARNWFPCNDHPRDKAQFRFEIVVPGGMTGVANGKLMKTQKDIPNALGEGKAGDMYVWEQHQPMATYLATVEVAEYVLVESTTPGGIHLRSYVFPDAKEAMEKAQPMITQAVDWMSKTFGDYPFEELGYVTVKGIEHMALETQTMIVISAEQLGLEGVLVHEMAHQWFGNWVSLDTWQDMWRNEGFATYVGDVLWPNREQMDVANKSFDSFLKKPPRTFPIGNPPAAALFSPMVYRKGAVFAHALRKTMGDEAFFSGLKTYFKEYGGKTATKDQFRQVLEKAGNQPLEEVFKTWLE